MSIGKKRKGVNSIHTQKRDIQSVIHVHYTIQEGRHCIYDRLLFLALLGITGYALIAVNNSNNIISMALLSDSRSLLTISFPVSSETVPQLFIYQRSS